MDNAFNIELDNVAKECEQIKIVAQKEMDYLNSFDQASIKKHPSCLDAWDYCFCVAIGYIALTITTDEELAIYLEDVHKASSGAPGEYDNLQSFLGQLLYHKGDYIDKVDTVFKNRKGENAYGLFHRLLWGHDVLSNHGDNPFALMVKQKGLSGILQAFQHLIADTASRQGLPLPGSSYLDFEKENGCISNYLIKIAEDLSEQSVGNKRESQNIYAHMFTIRAQDVAGNATIECLTAGYLRLRRADNAVKIAQFKLLAYSISFLGHMAIGAIRQNGIPYINITEFKEVIHNLAMLYSESWKETKQIVSNSDKCIADSEKLLKEVESTTRYIVHHDSDLEYEKELDKGQANINRLMGLLGKGDENQQ